MLIINQLLQYKGAIARQRGPFIEFGIGMSRVIAIFGLITNTVAGVILTDSTEVNIVIHIVFVIISSAIVFLAFWFVFSFLHKIIQSHNPFLNDDKI